MNLYELWKLKKKAQNAIKKFEFTVENVRLEKANLPRNLTKKEKLKKTLSPIYPPWKYKKDLPATESLSRYERIFFSGTREHSLARLALNILLVETFGIVMYFLLTFKYSFNPSSVGIVVSIIVHMGLLATVAFPKLMSYFIISIHMMLTGKIKNILIILIITISFEGSAMNVIKNMHQLASGVACIQNDVMASKNDVEGNLMDKGKIILDRFRQILRNVAGPMNKVREMLLKLDRKATKFVNFIQSVVMSTAKFSEQCRNFFKSSYDFCNKLFDESFEFCYRKVSFLGSISAKCFLIKDFGKVCSQVESMSNSTCVFPNILMKGVKGAVVPFYSAYFGAIEFALKKIFYVHIEATKWAMDKMKPIYAEIKNATKIRMEYESSDDGRLNAADDSTANLRASIKKSLMNIVGFYTMIIRNVSLFMKYAIIPIVLIWPFVYSLKFVYSYNYNDEYMNQYLTNEFIKIDQDCAMRGAKKLLPLTGPEAKKYIWRNQWKLTDEEKPMCRLYQFITVLTCFTPFCIVLVDIGVYLTLSNVFSILKKTTVDTPAHYELKVAGNGYMPKLMNEFLEVFSPITKNIRDRENRWRKCFADPIAPNYFEILIMVALFFLTLFMCRLKPYFKRQTLALADYFYPSRVRIRALTLYNSIMTSRVDLMTEMMKLMRKGMETADDIVMRRTAQSRGLVRADCVKCGKFDMRVSDTANVRVCIHCASFYCIDCFSFTAYCKNCQEYMQQVGDLELHFEDISDVEDDHIESETDIDESRDSKESVSQFNSTVNDEDVQKE